MQPIEVTLGDYTISTDPARLQIEAVHHFLSDLSYWAKGRPMEVITKSIEHSLNFGLYHGNRQVGFARVVTDYAFFAWLGDVFILEEERGHGLGKWLVETIISHPDLAAIKRFILATNDAQELYRRYGRFETLPHPERWMTWITPND